MLKFGHIESLYLLFIIPLIILFVILYYKWKNRKLKLFSSENLISNLSKDQSRNREIIKYSLKILSIFFLIIAISNPKLGTNMEKIKRKGIEIVIALDLSQSMLCEDIKPNRLIRAKQAISKLIDNLKGDKIGLVIFAGEAFIQLPITTDYSAAKMFLSTVNTKTINKQGTNLSSAIEKSLMSFDFNNEYKKSIIIITDGEDHEPGAIESVKTAVKKGVFIHTLSIGEKNGGLIPIQKNKGYKKDNEGNTIVTKPNFDFLSEIARQGNGKNINANNSEIGLTKLFHEINKLEKKEISDFNFTKYADRFQIFLFISFMFMLIDLLILNRNTIK